MNSFARQKAKILIPHLPNFYRQALRICMPVILLSEIFFVWSCSTEVLIVKPDIETQPVTSKGDAADDVAIYAPPGNSAPVAIIATDKKKGLLVFDMQGATRFLDSSGAINNVDVRTLADGRALVGGSNRTLNAMQFFIFDQSRWQMTMLPSVLPQSRIEEVYGFCFYQKDSAVFAFVIGKEGLLEGYALSFDREGNIAGSLIKSFRFGGQCEGMVADDEKGILYIAEEDFGIWALDLNNLERSPALVASLGDNKMLKADLEGLALYREKGLTYLVVSSQGNHSFGVFGTAKGLSYIGSFRIGRSSGVDRVSETDGFEIYSGEKGVMVAQDGRNSEGCCAKARQNFKVVKQGELSRAIALMQGNIFSR
jgi:3-phytase